MVVRPARLRRRALNVAVLAAVALATFGRGTTEVARPTAPADSLAQRLYPEVRLRKLHLVRPDLIPFPIDFDVYC